jgi:hypothetical protein
VRPTIRTKSIEKIGLRWPEALPLLPSFAALLKRWPGVGYNQLK